MTDHFRKQVMAGVKIGDAMIMRVFEVDNLEEIPLALYHAATAVEVELSHYALSTVDVDKLCENIPDRVKKNDSNE